MNDCAYCQNNRYLTNAFGEESPCPACREHAWHVADNVKRARRARMLAALAIEEFQRGSEGKRKEAV